MRTLRNLSFVCLLVLLWLAPGQQPVQASCQAWGEPDWAGINTQTRYGENGELEAEIFCQLVEGGGQGQCANLCNAECGYYNYDSGSTQVDCSIIPQTGGCGAFSPCRWDVQSVCYCGDEYLPI